MTAATFLALGDSYTIGEGVVAGERWPEQLVRRLREGGVAIAAPRIIATTGWTADELSAAIDRAAISTDAPFDLVSLLIGVNDQYRGHALDAYRREFSALLRRAIDLAGASPDRVVVLSIPDWGVTPFAEGRDRARISAEIDAFNAAARAEVVAAGARWVDVTPVSREPRDGWLTADGLHPSGAQYAAWAAATTGSARAALSASGLR